MNGFGQKETKFEVVAVIQAKECMVALDMERVWGGRTEEIHVQLDVAGQGKWQE